MLSQRAPMIFVNTSQTYQNKSNLHRNSSWRLNSHKLEHHIPNTRMNDKKQLTSSSQAEMNNNRCCIATITVTLKPVEALIQLRLSRCLFRFGFLHCSICKLPDSSYSHPYHRQSFVLSGKQIANSYLLNATDTPIIL
jgi:hypothetical protein